ncbi:ferrous iron transporter B [Mucisphaera calidilacus]|uniref:Ferrous iron transport protein B n=1 Tax=Mucisphaera calidilacus TaxID=2527982 RepID=A0A518BWF7_9BACT|nr:ferrous iron transporter B [Mucisphaera calidilacus]QDU71264.1 Ferrous iron transport protein B [Mucisphaera calidilacus]
MTTISLPVKPSPPRDALVPRIVLLGNPNAGKTTLFNRLTGLRAKTANFPGTTIERRVGAVRVNDSDIIIEDLPGLYALNAGNPEERIAAAVLNGELDGRPRPELAIVVIDATNLTRNLYLASQARETGIKVIVALNMVDLVEANGTNLDREALAAELGAPVVPISARSGQGIEDLVDRLAAEMSDSTSETPVPEALAACSSCSGCPHGARFDWAEQVGRKVAHTTVLPARWTDAIDRVVTHTLVGPIIFAAIMAGLFTTLFVLADHPMGWIEEWFGLMGDAVSSVFSDGLLHSLIVDGIIGGVGGVVVFLPQIVLLFFLLSLLEDTGYLARAAFVMDRWFRKLGLPGRAFVPMLSAHACAIPAIMSAKVIESKRDRMITIMILPLLTCAARLPVYAMIIGLLFPDNPLAAGLLMTGSYSLGIVAALVAALVMRHTIFPGQPESLVIELPTYKLPSFRNAILTAFDRGMIFIRKAGTVILAISLILWVMATFPTLPEDGLVEVASAADQARLVEIDTQTANPAIDANTREALEAERSAMHSAYAVEYSMAGRLGKLTEPIFAPLGFDWKINIGVISSFAAREVIVSTLGIVYGLGDAAEDEDALRDVLAAQTHADGSPVFTTALCLSILVFYVLAMQCLPTQAVTKRETGSWYWAAFQFGYMTVLAYTAALITYQTVSALGHG